MPHCFLELLVKVWLAHVQHILMAHCTLEIYNISNVETYQKKFKREPCKYDNVEVVGVQIEKWKDGFQIHQTTCISKLKKLSEQISYWDYKSLRAKLARFLNTRPNICCSVANPAQFTEQIFEIEKTFLIKDISKIVWPLQTSLYFHLNFPNLNKHFSIIQIYSDSFLQSNIYLSS